MKGYRFEELPEASQVEIDRWINMLASNRSDDVRQQEILRAMRKVLSTVGSGPMPLWRRVLGLLRANGQRFIYYEQRRRSEREDIICSRCKKVFSIKECSK
jgi:uncharacterized protein YbaR (Trm112 family)